jgi:predicted ATPase
MIKEIRIQNYKSIVDLTLELGKTNVFIGENGCGKTNILESFAMLSGAKNDRLTAQDLSNVGVRVAKPSLTRSSFASNYTDNEVFFKLKFNHNNQPKLKSKIYKSTIINEGKDSIHSKWIEREREDKKRELVARIDSEYYELLLQGNSRELSSFLKEYLIYDLNTPALRGQTPQSFLSPMGIKGEGLDVALASLGKNEMDKLLEFKYLISWLDEMILDANDELKFNNLRIKGNSQLYFSDKFMKKNALFNSENANEGVLHILFYLTLSLHKESPNFFAIDNIETALNPHLCRELMKIITDLNKDKQVLITTHNPAILDGLDLTNDEIRLFAVRRNRKGYTEARRIQFKSGTEKKHKLSEMWMEGTLGAISTNF